LVAKDFFPNCQQLAQKVFMRLLSRARVTFGMTSTKRSPCDSANVGRNFCQYFQGVFPDFQEFCEGFYGFCPDFQELCTDCRQLNTFGGALAPPLPAPLDLPISLNLLFNFSKQASTAVASNFHKSYSTYHLSRILTHDAIF